MKNKILTFLIITLSTVLAASADFAFTEESDYTGEAFFSSPADDYSGGSSSSSSKERGSTPPIKLLRLKIQDKIDSRDAKNMEFAPTKPETYASEVGVSEYSSKEIKEDFDEMIPDGFEADEESVNEKQNRKLFKNKKTKAVAENEAKEDIVLDCENVDYDTQNYLIKATGNVSVEFVKQKTVVKSDILTFDRMNNTVKAEGNVRILKSGRTVTGDYIFVDMNEENALIENPVTQSNTVVIRAEKGYVYGDKIVQEKGSMTVDDSYPINFTSGRRGPKMSRLLLPKDESLTEDIEKGIIKFKARDIKVTQDGEHEVIAIKKGKISKGDRTIFRVPAIKIYTNKNHDYAETNFWELGFYRGLGLYTGPGWVFELPKGSVLKAMPVLNYKSGFGIGAMTRFSSGTNQTVAAYGSAPDKFFVYGRQELDDNLFMQYGMNSFMDEWFLGKRRPKYGASIVYNKGYGTNNFLFKNKPANFRHRLEAGYFQDLDFDGNFEKIRDGGHIGTTRFRYMAQGTQSVLNYKDPEGLKAFSFNLISQLSAAVYGTGDTQVVGRFAPNIHLQYKRWAQDISYFFSAYDENTPMPRYDSFRYGKQNLYIREYLRLCRWLTVSWFGSINTTNDAINGKTLQENTFYFSFGPEDFKMHLGYDFERETFRCNVEVMMDAKGSNVEYDRFEIKQDKKAKKTAPVAQKKPNPMEAPTQPRVLQKAVVENLRVTDDVL